VEKRNSTNRTRRWRNANPGRHNTYMRRYRNTPIYMMLNDEDEIWFEKDPRKRKLVKQATPRWADADAIRNVYKKCEELNQRYPRVGFVVHHIIPISHPVICGLHVDGNLKVVSKAVKKVLGRKFSSKLIE